MPDFIAVILLRGIIMTVVMAFILSMIDMYFDQTTLISLSKLMVMNGIFTLVGSVTMLVFVLVLVEPCREVFKNDNLSTSLGLVASACVMFAVKFFLIGAYGLVFQYQTAVIFLNVLTMMSLPLMAYLVLRKIKFSN